MVKTINKSVCRGVAGRRSGKVKGVVIHNTADNLTAEQHMNRLARMTPQQLQAGFCHYFIDESTIVRTEDTYNMAWHTANPDGNANYIGYEVCRSTGSQSNFLQAEQNTFKQVAEDLKFYGLPANRNTVRLHREFVPTSCPHRSWDVHGKSLNAVKDYFIKEINKYMSGGGKEMKYHTQANRYYEIIEDRCVLYKKANFKEKYHGYYTRGSKIWISEVKKVGSAYMGKHCSGWVSMGCRCLTPA